MQIYIYGFIVFISLSILFLLATILFFVRWRVLNFTEQGQKNRKNFFIALLTLIVFAAAAGGTFILGKSYVKDAFFKQTNTINSKVDSIAQKSDDYFVDILQELEKKNSDNGDDAKDYVKKHQSALKKINSNLEEMDSDLTNLANDETTKKYGNDSYKKVISQYKVIRKVLKNEYDFISDPTGSYQNMKTKLSTYRSNMSNNISTLNQLVKQVN
ncbi:MAG: hypothetical protein LBM27_01410 [Lactobacillaceae bacterium]|jgi:predicted PurR-regulated permease PerM|nr:hypothetical protein [Lactobacillaceae bacterium]